MVRAVMTQRVQSRNEMPEFAIAVYKIEDPGIGPVVTGRIGVAGRWRSVPCRAIQSKFETGEECLPVDARPGCRHDAAGALGIRHGEPGFGALELRLQIAKLEARHAPAGDQLAAGVELLAPLRHQGAGLRHLRLAGVVGENGDHVALLDAGAAADPKVGEVSYRTFARKTVGQGTKTPLLRGIEVGGRTGVYFSREDLTEGMVGESVDGIVGYSPKSTREIVQHLLMSVAGAAKAVAVEAPKP